MLRCNASRLQEFLTVLIHTTSGQGVQSPDDVRLHVVTLDTIPKHLPEPFNSDVHNSVTGRVKVLGYWLAADVGQMLGKANHKGAGRLDNVDHAAGLPGDGIWLSL